MEKLAEKSLKNLLSKAESTRNLYEWQNTVNLDIQSSYIKLETLKFDDYSWRLKNRENFKKLLFGLLFLQNTVVFALFGLGLVLNKLAGLEDVFKVLIAGTLLETTSLILIIVKWLFSEIPYEKEKKF